MSSMYNVFAQFLSPGKRSQPQPPPETDWNPILADFEKIRELTDSYSEKLQNLSKIETAGLEIHYKLQLSVLMFEPASEWHSKHGVTCCLSVIRVEEYSDVQAITEMHAKTSESRLGFTAQRQSHITVAYTTFLLDGYKDLDSNISRTLMHPSQGIFQDHPTQSFESKGYFSLLNHLKFLFAAHLRRLYSITAATDATRFFLRNNYDEHHILFDENDHKDPSGFYAPNSTVYEIIRNLYQGTESKEEQDAYVIDAYNKWFSMIADDFLARWFRDTRAKSTLKFGARVNQPNQHIM